MDNISKAKTACFLFFCLPFFALSQKATFRLYTTADGLSRNTIWGLAQDRQGFLWATTDDGFNRFDGHRFLNHSNSDDPVFTKVRKAGGMAVRGDCLYYYKDNQIEVLNTVTGFESCISLTGFFSKNGNEWRGITRKLPNGEIVSVFVDEQKKAGYVARLNGDEVLRIHALPGFLSHSVLYIGDGHGNLFYPSDSTLMKVGNDGKVIQKIPIDNSVFGDLWAAGQNNSVFAMSGSNLVVLEEGAAAFRPHPASRHLRYPYIQDLLETPEGDLWICGKSMHLFFYDASADQLYDFTSQVERAFPNSVDLNSIFMDGTGTIWLATVIGLLKVVPQRSLFDTYFTEKYETCQGHCSFRGFTEGGQGAVYASYYSNICKLDDHAMSAPRPLMRVGHTPFEMLFHEGQIILNDGKLFDPISGIKSNPFNSKAYAYDMGLLEEDGQGRTWWAWGHSLYYLEKQVGNAHWKITETGKVAGDISAMSYDPFSQLLWFGNHKGMVAIKPSTMELEIDSEINKQSFFGVHYSHPDGKGGIWLGTEQGLAHFEPNSKTWKKYGRAEGLSNEFVHGIQAEGDSCLWLATNHGLSRFSIATEQFINFFKEDGLPDNEFNRGASFRASDGRLYFGGMRGIAAFYPRVVMEKYVQRQATGKLLLLSVSMTDDELDSTLTDYFHPDESSLDVHYHNKTVSFEFGLLDYQNTGAGQYSFQLDGYDNTWSKPSKNNTVTFSSLPSGKYVFRVKALGAQGHWLSGELAVRMTVHPPWWATWWAWCLYALAFAGLAFGIFSFLKKRWALQNQLLLEQQEATRLKELDYFKSRLYTNLTHEFRTPLTVILGMADEGKLAMEK